MKPIKNSYFCIDSNRTKMLFHSKGKSERFIDFYADEIEESVRRPTNEDSIQRRDPQGPNTQYSIEKFNTIH